MSSTSIVMVCDGDFGRFDRVFTRAGSQVEVVDPATDRIDLREPTQLAADLGEQLRGLYSNGRARRGHILLVAPTEQDVELVFAASFTLEGWRMSATDPLNSTGAQRPWRFVQREVERLIGELFAQPQHVPTADGVASR